MRFGRFATVGIPLLNWHGAGWVRGMFWGGGRGWGGVGWGGVGRGGAGGVGGVGCGRRELVEALLSFYLCPPKDPTHQITIVQPFFHYSIYQPY